jgi:hypothetical protein
MLQDSSYEVVADWVLNNRGNHLGQVKGQDGYQHNAFMRPNANGLLEVLTIESLAGPSSGAIKMSNFDEIVGTKWVPSGNTGRMKPFVYSFGHGLQMLPDVPNAQPWDSEFSVQEISDNGYMVGDSYARGHLYDYMSGQYRHLSELTPASSLPSNTSPELISWSGNTMIAKVPYSNQRYLLTASYADSGHDGVVSVNDIFTYLNRWFEGSLSADTNGDRMISIDDLFAFLRDYFDPNQVAC